MLIMQYHGYQKYWEVLGVNYVNPNIHNYKEPENAEEYNS